MALNYNRVIIAGNLTRSPELREAGASQVAKFGIACNRRWRDRDGNQQEETTFVDVEAWGKTGELVAQYLDKGDGCLVEGRLKLDSWEDDAGNKRSKLYVVADNVQFMPRTGTQDSTARQPDSQAAPSVPPPAQEADDEPPF